MIAAVVLIAATLSGADLEARFEQGVAAYRDGRWAEAETAWRALADAGVHDPRVEYNLGNAAYKQERLGEAIWRWERARRLAPADRDVATNLALARSQTRDRVEEERGEGPLGWLRRAQDRLGVDGQYAILVLLVWTLAATVVWGAARAQGFTPATGWTLAAIGFATGVAALSFWTTSARLDGTPRAVVLLPALEVVAGPGENQPTVFTVHEGTILEVEGERDRWVEVGLPDGLRGWVPGDAIGRI
ncbi:MAG TPA: SH3 domain-containing protein [Candidatus Polarisedimenticolaceae bacterium]